MSRFATFSSIVLFSSVLGLGCDSDSSGPAPIPPESAIEFGKLSEDDRRAAFDNVMGAPLLQGFMAIFQASLDNAIDAACPSRSEQGGMVTFEAGTGCTAKASETTYRGRVEAKNSPATGDLFSEDPGIDPEKPSEHRFIQFEVDGVKLDGTWTQSNSGGDFSCDISLMAGERGMKLKSGATCDDGGCTVDDSARGELVGLGQYAIVMDTELDAEGELVGGHIELIGKDKLTVDLSKKDAEGCTPYAIDGVETGKFCPPADEE